MGGDQFPNITRMTVFRKTCGSNGGDISRDNGDETEEQTDRWGQTKLRRQTKEGVLTEFVRMLRADSRHGSVRVRRGPLWLRLIEKLRNPSRALALTRPMKVSRAKRTNKRMVAALKSYTILCAGGEYASGGRWTVLTPSRSPASPSARRAQVDCLCDRRGLCQSA